MFNNVHTLVFTEHYDVTVKFTMDLLGIKMSSLDFILLNMCVKVCRSLLMNSQSMAEKHVL